MAVLYEYRCRNCNVTITSFWRDDSVPCGTCEGTAKRVWGFSLKLSMPDHYNPAVGKYVRNAAELRGEFNRLSDIATERTGIPHNYVPVSPHDTETLGITDEGLDATHDARVKAGLQDRAPKLR